MRVAVLAITTARVGLVAELVGIVAALVPVGSVVAALLWIDRWEPEPARLLWLAFGWGASVAAITALLINNTAEAVGDTLLAAAGATRSARSSARRCSRRPSRAPSSSGILLWLRNELDGVIDGVVYAGFVAAGFAFTENIYYFGRAFAEHGFGDTSTSGVVTAFILRGVLAPFCHPLFTAMIGIGVGISVRTPSRAVAILAPIGGYVAAVTLHAMWNAAATLGTAQTFLNVYFLVMVPIFIAGVMFVGWHRRREQKIVARALPIMVSRGWVDRTRRRAARQPLRPPGVAGRAARRRGKEAARVLGAYQAAVTELAFLWHAIRLGLAGADADEREARLVAALRPPRRRCRSRGEPALCRSVAPMVTLVFDQPGEAG